MLFELPTADEVDALAMTSPHISVRRMEFDRTSEKADLNYTPCKGQVVLVIRGPKGTAFVRSGQTGKWSLPSGRIGSNEEVQKAVKRVAKEHGLSVRSMELTGIYDVVFHHSDISIKRLHLVYEAVTDDEQPGPDAAGTSDVRILVELPPKVSCDDIVATAITDCRQK